MTIEALDFDDDDFAEVAGVGAPLKLIGPCVVSMRLRKARKSGKDKKVMTITIRPSLCIEDGLEAIVNGARVTAGYADKHHALMFKLKSDGAFHWRTPAVGTGEARFIHISVPSPGVEFLEGKQALADIECKGDRLFVIIPREFWTPLLAIAGPKPPEEQPQPPAPAAKPRDLTPGLLGDPPPDRSALSGKRR